MPLGSLTKKNFPANSLKIVGEFKGIDSFHKMVYYSQKVFTHQSNYKK
jgi:hypothetical protein